MLPRYAELNGLLPNTAWSEYAPLLTGLLGSVLVIAALLHRLQRQCAHEGLRLERAVRERTLDLDEARARAERSDRAKGRLLGYLGHDLRAPLASMVQVARQLRPDAEFEAGSHAIEHSSLLALEMIDEMQHFARDPQYEARLEILPAPLYLHSLLEEIVAQSQALARAGDNRLTLDASSRPGHGACFKVRLPCVAAAEDEVQWPPVRPWLSQPVGDGQTALLLDSCGHARAALRERLVLAGFECLEAGSPAEAEPLMAAQPVDLVVAEPALGGDLPAWLAGWQRRRPGLAVLRCSRRHDPTDLGPPRLLKPVADSEWWPTLSAVLRHEAALH